MRKVALGVDVGGTNTKIGIVEQDGNILAQTSMSTHSEENISVFLSKFEVEVNQLIDTVQASAPIDIIGMGIGAPNANCFKGTIEYAPNIRWGDIVPFIDELKKRWNLPMAFTNDANAAAIGELIFGNAKGMKDFIVITLGTGLGSGIVANGKLVVGHDGYAGELGHTLVKIDGRYCGCGKRGCLETYVSATGIKRTVYKLLADFREPSELRKVSFDNLSAHMITEAAIRGDKIAIEAFEYTGRILGMKLADAVVHTSPEAIFLFGGLVRAGEFIFNPTKHHFQKHLMRLYQGKVKILPSGLMDKNAAILGAAALIWQGDDNEMIL